MLGLATEAGNQGYVSVKLDLLPSELDRTLTPRNASDGARAKPEQKEGIVFAMDQMKNHRAGLLSAFH